MDGMGEAMMPEPTNRVELLKMLPKDSVGAELGTYLGNFAACILRHVQPRLLYLVDIWQHSEDSLAHHTDERHAKSLRGVIYRFRAEIAAGIVRPVCELTQEATRFVRDGELDWVYIDACHTYAACLHDLQDWYPKVKPGGIVAGHDYGSIATVKQAVDDFVAEMGIEALHITEEQWPSFWFRKPT